MLLLCLCVLLDFFLKAHCVVLENKLKLTSLIFTISINEVMIHTRNRTE